MSKVSLFFVVILLTVVPGLLVRFNFLRRFYEYRGVVRDALEFRPLELFKIEAGGAITFTDRQGQFNLVLSDDPNQLRMTATTEYENDRSQFSCRPAPRSFWTSRFSCEALAFPQPFNVAIRVLSTEVGQGLITDGEIRQRKTRLWNYLAAPARQLWQSQKQFVDDLVLQDIIRSRLKLQLTAYQVSEAVRFQDYWVNANRQKVFGEVAKVTAELTDGFGGKRSDDLYFLREDGIWRYLAKLTPATVRSFNRSNAWVLRDEP